VPPYTNTWSEDEEYLAYVRGAGVSEDEIKTALRMKVLVPAFLELAATEILAGTPRVVGFSTVFQQNVASLVLSKILKARDPSLVIVFGGDNCDGPMGAALHESFPWIDIVVRGEGECALVEVVSDVIADRPIRAHDGLCLRVNSQPVAVPQGSASRTPMADVPEPTYDEFFARLEHSPLRAELWPEIAILF